MGLEEATQLAKRVDPWMIKHLTHPQLIAKYTCRRCYAIICIIFRHFYDVFNTIVHYAVYEYV